MTAAEEKIKVIEKVIETNDALLLREVASLLHKPSLTDYPSQPMTKEMFLAKIDRAEDAYRKGAVTDHEDVKKFDYYVDQQVSTTWTNPALED